MISYFWRKFFRNIRHDSASLPRTLAGRALFHKRLQLGQLLGRFGSCPKFLIIGVQKGGTTLLYSHLAAHLCPHVSPVLAEEGHYFDFHYGCS